MLEDPGNMDSSSVSSLPHFSRCDSKSHSDFAISYKKQRKSEFPQIHRIKRHGTETAASQPVNSLKQTQREIEMSLSRALSWLSWWQTGCEHQALCAEKRLFRTARSGTEQVFYPVTKEWEEEAGGKSFQPTHHSPAYLGFPQSLFNWIILQAVTSKRDVHRQPPWTRAAQEACVGKRRNGRLLRTTRVWTTSAALRRRTGALVGRHTIHRKGLQLGLNMRTRRRTEFGAGEGGKKKTTLLELYKPLEMRKAVSTSTLG